MDRQSSVMMPMTVEGTAAELCGDAVERGRGAETKGPAVPRPSTPPAVGSCTARCALRCGRCGGDGLTPAVLTGDEDGWPATILLPPEARPVGTTGLSRG